MPTTPELVEIEPQEDMRSAIEAAFEAHEEPKEVVKEAPKEAPKEEPNEVVKEEPKAVEEVEEEKPPVDPALDRAPQSWRPAEKAKWSQLDPDIRQEVLRREKEITKALDSSAQARQVASSFHEAIRPFESRLQALKADPVVAVRELLRADYILSSAPKVQRAQLMAKLISDYDIDLQTLDSVLSGQALKPEDEVASKVDQLLQERLQPFQQFMAQQEQARRHNDAVETTKVQETIANMEADTVKYPHFADVKEDMADLIEINSRRGVYLPLEQAYNRAIAANPEISQLVNQQRVNETMKQQAAEANAKAQRALKASKSVVGTPALGSLKVVDANDRRATIAAAFDELAGR